MRIVAVLGRTVVEVCRLTDVAYTWRDRDCAPSRCGR